MLQGCPLNMQHATTLPFFIRFAANGSAQLTLPWGIRLMTSEPLFALFNAVLALQVWRDSSVRLTFIRPLLLCRDRLFLPICIRNIFVIEDSSNTPCLYTQPRTSAVIPLLQPVNPQIRKRLHVSRRESCRQTMRIMKHFAEWSKQAVRWEHTHRVPSSVACCVLPSGSSGRLLRQLSTLCCQR